MTFSIRGLYPYTLIEGQGMGTAYEYYSKLRVLRKAFALTRQPRSILVAGLPETHGFDLDFCLLARDLDCTLLVCEDRPNVLSEFSAALAQIGDPVLSAQVETVQLDSLVNWSALGHRRFDWVLSTASAQRLQDPDLIRYVQAAIQHADRILLFFPNQGNRAHLTLTGLRGLDEAKIVRLCRLAADRVGDPILTSGYCDIAPFPPGLQRSEQAKENALHSPLETVAMVGLEWWCRGEWLIPTPLQRRLAHLVYVGLDMDKAPV